MREYQLAISNIAWQQSDDEEIYTAMQHCGFTGLEIAPTRIFPSEPYENLTGAALFGGTTSFLDTGEGLEERLATLASRDDDRRAQEDLKAALLEAARNMQTAQEQPLKVELHSTLELDGAVLAQSREDIMIREAARR